MTTKRHLKLTCYSSIPHNIHSAQPVKYGLKKSRHFSQPTMLLISLTKSVLQTLPTAQFVSLSFIHHSCSIPTSVLHHETSIDLNQPKVSRFVKNKKSSRHTSALSMVLHNPSLFSHLYKVLSSHSSPIHHPTQEFQKETTDSVYYFSTKLTPQFKYRSSLSHSIPKILSEKYSNH